MRRICKSFSIMTSLGQSKELCSTLTLFTVFIRMFVCVYSCEPMLLTWMGIKWRTPLMSSLMSLIRTITDQSFCTTSSMVLYLRGPNLVWHEHPLRCTRGRPHAGWHACFLQEPLSWLWRQWTRMIQRPQMGWWGTGSSPKVPWAHRPTCLPSTTGLETSSQSQQAWTERSVWRNQKLNFSTFIKRWNSVLKYENRTTVSLKILLPAPFYTHKLVYK